ncbi:MAG: DUF629 domain-containing protein [Nanopusillaceae archaeon]|jgi:uncharacterized C2H2 Zn-finger protein
MLRAIRKIGRDNKKIFICPLCGHVFVDSKKYTRHLIKSHLRNSTTNKRKMQKMMKRLLIIKIKEENNVPLDKYEKYMKLKSKFNNIKIRINFLN